MLIALLVSAAVHGLLAGGYFLLMFTTLLLSERNAVSDIHRLQAARPNMATIPEPQLTFIEVDTSMIATEAPKDPKYYAARNSVAANPDTRNDTDTPKIDGTQTHVPKTDTVPRTQAFPLQPTPPLEPVLAPVAQPEKPEVAVKPAPKPGDLTMVKPAESTSTEPEKPKPAPTPSPPRQRPTTLAQVQQQNLMPGEKMQQGGGVKRARTVTTLGAVGSPFGEYDARIIAAIQQHWYDLVDSQGVSRQRTGKVVVEFRLNYDGRITDMKVVDNTVGDLLMYLCQKAIAEPAPFERWSSDMRLMVGADYREVKFTFYYD